MEVTKTPVLKDVYTNNLYQSTFLPIFQKAETRIKELILAAFFLGQSKYLLRLSIARIIVEVDKKIPADLHDRDQYLKGLQVKSDFFIRKYYDEQHTKFTQVKERILSTVPTGVKAPILETPKDAVKFIKSKDIWAEAKGSPNVINYPKELNVRLNELANETMTVQSPGKKPISVWQKAELDVRYEHQMQTVQSMRLKGVKYAYLSSHPNCSKRCACFQGELVALEGHATSPQKVVNHKTFAYKKSSFVMGVYEGHKVYSLSDIMDVVDDKYGYHNNIISGFNCRHRLIPYTGQMAPTEYTSEEIAEQRKIEAQIRQMERNIRLQKTRLALYNKIGETQIAKQLKKTIDKLVTQYKAYCERHGYAWHEYRIKV